MSYSTAWIIGSVKALDYDVTINASAQSVTGSRYLYHATSSLSILAGMVAAMTAAGLGTPAAELTRDRKVKLTNGVAFSVTWTDTGLRDLLGFTGNLAAGTSHTATLVSPLLWSPAKPLTPELSPHGTLGIRRPLAFYSMSPSDGSAFVVKHGTRTDQRWSCTHVDTDRVYTASDLGGEWATFFDEVAAKGYQWYVYPDVTEDPGSATAATLSGALGPYVFTPAGRAPGWDYRRSQGFTWTDKRADVVIPCRDAPEYT